MFTPLPSSLVPPNPIRPPALSTQPVNVAPHARTLNSHLMEASNVLSHPSGPEFQFTAGEGTYVLKDDLQLAIPPPHPSEAQPPNPNPLAIANTPPTSGTKLSIVTISPKTSTLPKYLANASSSSWSIDRRTHSIKESSREGRSSSESTGQRPSSEAPSSFPNGGSSGGSKPLNGHNPVFGDSNALLNPPAGKDALKRRKPKNNIVKSNSSFVSRVIPHEHFQKKSTDRDPSAPMLFCNIHRGFQWLDLGSKNIAEQVVKILFTRAHALCHDVNDFTKSVSHLDVILGFSSGDIIWYEAMTQKYARINKTHSINANPILDIQWIPGSESLFLAAHSDGALVVYDKEREDAPFTPEEQERDTEPTENEIQQSKFFQVRKSVNSKNQKSNPVAYWQASKEEITAFSFSPDGKLLAIVSEDGSLRIINMIKEKIMDMFSSYYGGINCLAWSPDGKYIITGSQDDLVSVWSVREASLVARCQGHQSWVKSVAFDAWRCDERNYRFGSVGEDCRMLLWDFSVGTLHRPKAASVRQRGSISSHAGPVPGRTRAESIVTTTSRFRSNSNVTAATADEEDETFVRHPVEPRSRVPMLPPVMSKVVDKDPLSWIGFQEAYIMTACANGHIRTWARPTDSTENR